MKLVPLIGYSKVDAEETRHCGFWDDRVTRLWALVSYKQEKPVQHVYKKGERVPVGEVEYEQLTAEFCVKAGSITDFCGGTWFASPQVTYYQRGGWSNGGFANPGQCASIDCSWDAWHEDRAIDLEAFTGQAVWTADEVLNYGRECIAMACVSLQISRGTNGWVCSDYCGGGMETIHKIMCSYCDTDVPMGPAVMLQTVDKITMALHVPTSMATYKITCKDHESPAYHNSNSGNSVRIMTGNVERFGVPDGDGEVECPSCEEYHDLDCCNECHNCGHEFDEYRRSEGENYGLGGQVGRVLNNPLYLQQARRFDWSNG